VIQLIWCGLCTCAAELGSKLSFINLTDSSDDWAPSDTNGAYVPDVARISDSGIPAPALNEPSPSGNRESAQIQLCHAGKTN